MKLVEVLSVAIAALSSIGFAAIPADYVELESIVVPRGVTLDVGTTPEKDNVKVSIEVAIGEGERGLTNVTDRLVIFDESARCFGGTVTNGDVSAVLTASVKVSSGEFGLYDGRQKAFFPLIYPPDEQSCKVVPDDTLDKVYVDPGQVLKHNHRYLVTEDRSVDASAMPGVSALRVPRGAAVIIDIAEGKTLTVKGGPGYGRLPGGAGIEVPNGAKLVVTGSAGSRLVVSGGAAASGGKGYGGMGGQFTFFQMSGELDPQHWPYDDFDPGSYSDVTNNGVAASSFAKDPLYFGLTGNGGDGGDGGGGAGAGIGTRGGAGGLGGKGPLATFVTGGLFYDEPEERRRYDKYATFFGHDKKTWYLYDKTASFVHNGRDGQAGKDGQAAATCGEIIILGDVSVEASAGAAGEGGENGPFGASAQANETAATASTEKMDVLSIVTTVAGVAGTIASFIPGGSLVSGVLGVASSLLSVGILGDQAGSSDCEVMKDQLWFTGGGGGGGGAGGLSGFGIGAGGAGGGAGGAGGEGFFELGVKSVYTLTDSILGTHIDVTTPPLQVSGHGGAGGIGDNPGKTASFTNRGEAQHQPKGEGDTYNFFKTALGDSRLGADSWWKGVEAYSGLGGAGGNQAEVNTNRFTFLCSDARKVSGSFAIEPATLKDGCPSYDVIYDPDNGNPNQEGQLICGTIIEQAPSAAGVSADLVFAGYYTQPNGQGVQYFDCYGHPVGSPKATSTLHLYAHWVEKDKMPTGFKTVVDGSTLNIGDTLRNGTIYFFQHYPKFYNNDGPGLAVEAGATVVIYIDSYSELDCYGSWGVERPAYPGIYVPSNSTLIVTGEGGLVAVGGDGTVGDVGGDGKSNAWGDDDDDAGSTQGGAGGNGGNGAAAGIGGCGGVGGKGGTCEKNEVWYTQVSGWGSDGKSGTAGEAGGNGEACGTVYLLGHVTVNARPAPPREGGAAGATSSRRIHRCNYVHAHAAASGGGGGGGGGGAGRAIGGGGAGGGGGGAGGGGCVVWDSDEDFWPDGGVGAGGKSVDEANNGNPPSRTDGITIEELYVGEFKGGNGAAGGAAGTDGANGRLYVNEAVVLNPEVFNERQGDWEYSFGHYALGRTITLKRDGKEDYPQPAMIGCPLPILPDSEIRPGHGLVLKGAYVVEPDGEINTNKCWYGAKGVPAIEQYTGLDDVTLQFVYELDTERMAAAPQVFNFRYDGENHVAYDAENLPGSTYLCGVTNATETGAYSYSVRLDDDYTIWSDLDTNCVKTISWEVTRGVFTNEWANNIITYDWTKTREANIYAITNDPASTFGFELPEDAKISFRFGEQTQVNEQRLVVTIGGMRNYFDKTYYGVFSCEQPFELQLKSHYPWAAKLDIFTVCKSVKIPEEDLEKFKTAYGDCKILAYIHIPDGEGGVREVCLNEDTAATVREALESGSQSVCVTVDLKSIPELAGVREYSLPVYVSLDGQVFQGGSVSVDTTAEETAGGYPRYTVEDVKDIFDIECFTGFVRYELAESRDSDDDSVLLAIGTEEKPGERFVPRTPSGDPITYGWVKWTPTSVGEYRLEHWVVDSDGAELGYCRAYFNVTAVDPQTDRGDVVRVEVTRRVTGEKKGYASLAAAVADLRYGDTVIIVSDVQMERVKVPSGTSVVVRDGGVFRSPQDGDFTGDYVEAEVRTNSHGKVVSADYYLNKEMVRPSVVDAKVVDEGGNRAFGMTVDNVRGGLFYLLNGSADLKSWALREKFFVTGATSRADLTTPALDAQGFFTVDVTDDPMVKLDTEADASGEVTVTGSRLFTPGAPFAGKLVIPTEIGGGKVTTVGANAFGGRSDISSVDVALGIRELSVGAFANCGSLVSVSLPNSLKSIRSEALGNTALEELVVPEGVETVGEQDWRGLKVLRFLGKPTTIGALQLSKECVVYVPQDAGWEGVPSGNWNGARLEYWVDFTIERDEAGNHVVAGGGTIPADGRLWIPAERDGRKIAAIKYEAFRDRSDVRKLVVAEGIADIGGGAFLGCENLTEVELPASLVHLGRNVFGNAANKSNITSISFAGDAPSYDADIGLDADKCTIHVSESAEGWGNRWQGCPVERR